MVTSRPTHRLRRSRGADPCGGAGRPHRPVGHGEFLETLARRILSFVARTRQRAEMVPGRDDPLLGEVGGGYPAIGQVLVRSLTAQSLGNATGLDSVDLCPDRLLSQVDWRVTLLNGLASGTVVLPAAPRRCATDRQAVDAALAALGKDGSSARVVHIRSTARLREIEVSQAYLPELEGRADLAVSEQGWRMAFDDDGTLPTDWSWVEGGWW